GGLARLGLSIDGKGALEARLLVAAGQLRRAIRQRDLAADVVQLGRDESRLYHRAAFVALPAPVQDLRRCSPLRPDPDFVTHERSALRDSRQRRVTNWSAYPRPAAALQRADHVVTVSAPSTPTLHLPLRDTHEMARVCAAVVAVLLPLFFVLDMNSIMLLNRL